MLVYLLLCRFLTLAGNGSALCNFAENRASRLIARNGFAMREKPLQFTKN